MGKKKKVDINGKPLESVTIGKVSDNKFGWIGIIILFALFLGIIYYLPQLSILYNEYIKGTPPVGNNVVNNNNTIPPVVNPGDEPAKPESGIYIFGTDTKVQYNGLEISAVSLVNNVLSFKVTNNTDERIDLSKEEIYLSTYNKNTDDKLILNNIAITGPLFADESRDYNFEIKTGALYFDVKKIVEEDYTYIDLEEDENGYAELVCKKGDEKLTYTFFHNELQKLEHSVTVDNTVEDYMLEYSSYSEIVREFENTPGIEVRLSELDEYLWFKIEVDYLLYGEKLDNNYYFAKDATPRVVNFKMESVLFECS